MDVQDAPAPGEPPDDPLAILFAAAELRVGCRELTEDHTRRAMDAFCTVAAHYPDMEPVARMAMAPLSARVRADAAEILAAVRDDPAAPSLERAYASVMSELSTLATVYVTTDVKTRTTPDPADEYADEYRAVCALIKVLMVASVGAQPTWRLLRSSRAIARARPPPRRRPRTPLADDREYYI